ncbi:MAG: hypothetical protein C5S45_08780 [Candidatus Methanocomedens sp.]|nr:MAG: hypothetical protein C5S45_08780 [ANME-2 cluster archaeon]
MFFHLDDVFFYVKGMNWIKRLGVSGVKVRFCNNYLMLRFTEFMVFVY